MKPIAGAIVAATLLAFAAAPALAAPGKQQQKQRTEQSHCNVKPGKKQSIPRTGKCLDGWKQEKPLTDYGKRGLNAPGKGHQWVENNGSYVLVEIATGLIQQIVNGR